jgi:hypothetical protein
VDAAAPAKALPSAAALFSRNWKADPKARPAAAVLAPRAVKPAASHLIIPLTACPLTQKWQTKRRGANQNLTLFDGKKGRLGMNLTL